MIGERVGDGSLGGEAVVYEAPDAEAVLDVRPEEETVWLIERQMADVFQTTRQNVNQHLQLVFLDGQLDWAATSKEILLVRTEGRRRVRRAVAHGHGGGVRRPAPSAAAGHARRDVRARAVPLVGPGLHRLRGRRRRQAGQDDGRIPPVPRGRDGGRGDPARGRATAGAEVGRRARGGGTRTADQRAAVPATGASESSGTPKGRARA